jgi:hypothetical protein
VKGWTSHCSPGRGREASKAVIETAKDLAHKAAGAYDRQGCAGHMPAMRDNRAVHIDIIKWNLA